MNKELRKTAFCRDQESDSTNFIRMDKETINDLLRMFTVFVCRIGVYFLHSSAPKFH